MLQLHFSGLSGWHTQTSAAALVEALMGFQFNHVGGGTKTRRPITLHMKYNAACVQPNCFLITEDYGEQEVTLEELQVSSAAACSPCTCTDSALLAVSWGRQSAKQQPQTSCPELSRSSAAKRADFQLLACPVGLH